ncbi:MAG: NfeD family protein [Rubricoccaceae bacterium]
MLSLYWYCLLGGFALSALVFALGDVIEGVLDGLEGIGALLDPLSILGGVTGFGGAGVLLSTYTGLGAGPVAVLAAVSGLALAVVMHFAYVRPMRRGENSTGFSVREYVGRIGEVNVAIPARGYGEVLVRMGASTTFQAAASFDGTPIATGTAVVVVEVEPDGTLRVSPFEDPDETPTLPVASAPRLPEPALP